MYNPGNPIVGVSSFYTPSLCPPRCSPLTICSKAFFVLLKNVKKTVRCNIPCQSAS